jgi:outer membrane protein
VITFTDTNLSPVRIQFMQNARQYSKWITLHSTIFILISAVPSLARQTTAMPLTIRQAVESAITNYPSLAVSQEQINAATAGIDLARTAYLPRVDTLVQVNRATRNNVFGLLLPQSVIPSISGPVIGSNNFGTVWGTAVGGLVTWEPFDFGLRSANVSVASASRNRAQATLRRTEFEVSVATADAYLTLTAAQETVRAAQAAVEPFPVRQ